jgi:ABC-type nitrate/sulfonate/bicarbonate transport system permease component
VSAGVGQRGVNQVAPLVCGCGVLLGLWVVGGRAGWADGMVVTPAEAVQPIRDSTDVYLRATWATVSAALRGLLVGGCIAFLAALVAATVPALRRSITRLAAVANAAPWVAVAPVLLVVLGRNRGPTAVAAIAVFFFIFVSTSVGLGAAPAAAHDVATALGAGRARRVWSVQLPAAWPSVVDGLKLAAPAALAGAVFGEWYGAPRGLGVLLITGMQGARAPQLWSAALLAAACGLAAYAVLALARFGVTRRYGGSITQSAQPVTRHRRGQAWVVGVEALTVAALVALAVLAWWAWIELFDVSPLVVPRPAAVWDDLVAAPGEYVAATAATLSTAAASFLIGTAAGLVAALAASRSRLLAGMTVPLVVVLAATPLVALFPLFARIFGYQPNTVRLLGAVLVFYPVFVYARSGLTSTRAATLDVCDALGGSGGTRFRRVVVPEAVPHIASGVRIAAGSAVIAAVVGEFLIGREGLGVEFSYSYQQLDLSRAFGAALVIVVVSVAVFAAAGWLERAVHARWS